MAESEGQDEAPAEARHAERVVLASVPALHVTADHGSLRAEHLSGQPSSGIGAPRADELGGQTRGRRDGQAIRPRGHPERGHRHPGQPAGGLAGSSEYPLKLAVHRHVADEHLELTQPRHMPTGGLDELPMGERGTHAIGDDEEQQYFFI